jgi:NitT/TauT family transport system substrate-binding protein
MNRRQFLALAGLSPALLAACAAQGNTTGNRTKVRLPMGFIPNVQYSAYYIASDKGYFAAEGIDVEFDYKFETDGVKLVGANELPFAVVSGEQVVLARSKGLPVKYFAQWYREFPIAIFSLAEKNIKGPADLKGKKIGVPILGGATYVGWKAYMKANGLQDSDVTVDAIGFTQAAAVQQGKVDAAIGYSVNEPIVLAKKGIPVNTIEIGKQVSMVANGLMTNEQTIKDNPKLVAGMARALKRGIAGMLANADEAMTISAKFVEKLDPKDPIQRAVLDATIANMRTNEIGVSDPKAWENTQDVLLFMGQIKEKMDVNTFYTNEFVKGS